MNDRPKSLSLSDLHTAVRAAHQITRHVYPADTALSDPANVVIWRWVCGLPVSWPVENPERVLNSATTFAHALSKAIAEQTNGAIVPEPVVSGLPGEPAIAGVSLACLDIVSKDEL
ncbi:hypothetical protein [Paracidobacterium acidisoli]|uniref:Uncharacterized protein n=1 Tax=Paracidobacterium acidisoli TaxID=2303751 RepID=A0A372IRN3_9BACT|nr:hypothetical protein [Paracidobacterium acidisoli]MBT9330470.1 hypothetical protein [Paracidobacterium acidisoli]